MLAVLALSGCSKESWLSHYFIARAENAYTKAHELRVRKGTERTREKLYGGACRDFVRAYQYNPQSFTLAGIEYAIDACRRVKDPESEEKFLAFAEVYIQEHPTEAEHGDAFPVLAFE